MNLSASNDLVLDASRGVGARAGHAPVHRVRTPPVREPHALCVSDIRNAQLADHIRAAVLAHMREEGAVADRSSPGQPRHPDLSLRMSRLREGAGKE